MKKYLLATALAFSSIVHAAPTTVPQVDLNSYLGTWYEIGRLPMSFQNKCASDVKATYTLKSNGKITIKNECKTQSGKMTDATGEAYAIDQTNSKLKVSFLPSILKKLPFGQADYWVLALGEKQNGKYQSALVGTPNNKYLWILSRDKTLDSTTYDRYLGIAKQNGYDLTNFTKTAQ